MIKHTLTILGVGLALAACAPHQPTTLPTATVLATLDEGMPESGVVHIVSEYSGPFDARHGDRVDVILDPAGDLDARCDRMGGHRYADTLLCMDVDF